MERLFEEDRKVVDNCITSSDLLEELRRNPKDETSEMLGWSSSCQVFETEIGVDGVLDLDRVKDTADIDRCLTSINRFTIERSHDRGGVSRAILFAQPKTKHKHPSISLIAQ